MRPPQIRASLSLDPRELVVDNFAGGGGASTGLEAAIGRPVDIAVNHDAEAIAMHRANHPETRHYCEDVWQVDPREACAGRPVGVAWFSPDCTHFSRAKGGKPRDQKIRGLAWVAVRWAREVAPRVIVLENVEEFETWGPLDDEGQPVPERVGETFREWLGQLSGLGYAVEFRSVVAADHGAPTTRKRLFLIARRDGLRPVWPEPTHGKGRPLAWRPASEIIDWSLPCPSIFDREKPLAEATLRRIAEGIRRYVLESPRPFIVRHGHYSTITGAGLEPGKGWGVFRGQPLDIPLATVCATNDKHIVVPCLAPLVTAQWGNSVGRAVEEPLGTVTAIPHHYLTAAFLTSHYGRSVGQEAEAPVGSVTGRAHHSLTAALITKHYGGVVGHGPEQTLGTVTAQDHHALTAAFLTKFYGTSTGSSLQLPLPTVTSGGGRGGGHLAEVRAFLIKYYGSAGRPQTADLFAPLGTVTSRDRFGLGMVLVEGEPYQITDIGMRMLQPHELFAAQGFPGWYVIDPEFNGRPLCKTAQIRLAGNSVSPVVAQALAAANVGGGNALS